MLTGYNYSDCPVLYKGLSISGGCLNFLFYFVRIYIFTFQNNIIYYISHAFYVFFNTFFTHTKLCMKVFILLLRM